MTRKSAPIALLRRASRTPNPSGTRFASLVDLAVATSMIYLLFSSFVLLLPSSFLLGISTRSVSVMESRPGIDRLSTLWVDLRCSQVLIIHKLSGIAATAGILPSSTLAVDLDF
ncbi:hypothetical protein PGQ11_006042 [Apiospora arundinis]|uniref:Uncharacterized protein n=1 Tax=Apiospora arundinis TaxID=335852 RepID=A0ABR2IRG7_9PEZI